MTATTVETLLKMLNKFASAKGVQPAERCNSNTARLIADAYREDGDERLADIWAGAAQLADALQAYLDSRREPVKVSVWVAYDSRIWIVRNRFHNWKNGGPRLTRTYYIVIDEKTGITKFDKNDREPLAESPRLMAERITARFDTSDWGSK